MDARPIAPLAAIVSGLVLVAGPAAAADPLGLYIGGAIGQSRVSVDNTVSFALPRFDERHSAWKVLAGLRPVSFIGAEVEYIDFGHPSRTSTQAVAQLQVDAEAKGVAMFGVAYLPLGPIDVFAKAGPAKLDTSANARIVSCPPGVLCIAPFHYRASATHVGYGAGVQLSVRHLAARAEYERISTGNVSPELVSIGVTWSF